jgi:hypothetical protein
LLLHKAYVQSPLYASLVAGSRPENHGGLGADFCQGIFAFAGISAQMRRSAKELLAFGNRIE